MCGECVDYNEQSFEIGACVKSASYFAYLINNFCFYKRALVCVYICSFLKSFLTLFFIALWRCENLLLIGYFALLVQQVVRGNHAFLPMLLCVTGFFVRTTEVANWLVDKKMLQQLCLQMVEQVFISFFLWKWLS